MSKNAAFSLVELSIVLVILGLLTGGILAGQSLIRAAELRAVTSEYNRYLAATQTFRDKYMAIPGDMREATRFWNRQVVAGHCTSNHGLATAGTPGACDGKGNGSLSWSGAGNSSGEAYQFWRHLALAGLIEGSYTGYAGTTDGNTSEINSNIPASHISNAGWDVYSMSASGYPAEDYAINYGNHFSFGSTISASQNQGKALRPEEAWNIDTKLDDGKPAQGKIIARYWNNQCAAADDGTHAANDLAASYKLSDNSLQCALFFINAF